MRASIQTPKPLPRQVSLAVALLLLQPQTHACGATRSHRLERVDLRVTMRVKGKGKPPGRIDNKGRVLSEIALVFVRSGARLNALDGMAELRGVRAMARSEVTIGTPAVSESTATSPTHCATRASWPLPAVGTECLSPSWRPRPAAHPLSHLLSEACPTSSLSP
jgi:hypothetical protein